MTVRRPTQSRTRLALALSLVLGALALPGVAAAQLDVQLRLVDPPEDADKYTPPSFRAVVAVDRPGLTEKQFKLKDVTADPQITVDAKGVVTYKDSDEPMALVVLVQGDERWMGNDTYRPEDDPDRLPPGAYRGVGPALDLLAQAGPPGSKAALLVFAGKVDAKQPMGDASQLSSSSLGAQQDYNDLIISLVAGVEEAYTTLATQSGYRKILIVMGDGTGEREDISADLRERINKLREIGAEVYTLHWTASTTDSPQGQANFKRLGYSGDYRATTIDNIATYADSIVKRIGARYYVDFPGTEFLWDGTEHQLVVLVDKAESEPIEIAFPEVEQKSSGSLWWLWLLLILLVVVIIIIILVKRSNRQPVAVAPPPMMEAPPPAAAAPQKTIMLGIGGSDDGMPIVGWIVPLSGPHQYQTFKLLQGATKVGTGGDSHIHINDTYMSTEHAEIVCSAVGFILNDGGSTNGTFVNQKRIASHELVDNDVFTLGKTDFKFKSIN